MPNRRFVRFLLSGNPPGGPYDNTDPSLSLGGPRTSDPDYYYGQVVDQTNPLGGAFTFRGASGHDASALGTGTLHYLSAGAQCAWQAAGDTIGPFNAFLSGPFAFVSGNGDSYVSGNFGFSGFPPGDTTAPLTVSPNPAPLFDDVTLAQATTGHTEYRCIYAFNESGGVLNYSISMLTQTTGGDTVTSGQDPVTIGNGQTTGIAQTIPTDETAPVGVTFAVSWGPVAVANNEALAIWVRRVTQAGAPGVNPNYGRLMVTAV